jgi:cell wall-associated NlpC family hydrolase
MYAGNGMTIHAPSEGYTVMIVPMLNMEFIGAGRPY